MEAQKPEADLVILEQALKKWTQSSESERGDNWWEWPATNWVRVERDYKKLLAEKKQ